MYDRDFLIECSWKDYNVVVSERDFLGTIGEILSLVSQLDPDQSVTITCISDNLDLG